MAEDKKTHKVSINFERGSQVPSQNKVPTMPAVKPVADKEKKVKNIT